jgi:hypothetical protein
MAPFEPFDRTRTELFACARGTAFAPLIVPRSFNCIGNAGVSKSPTNRPRDEPRSAALETPPDTGTEYYCGALAQLTAAAIPFLIGGAYALEVHAGVHRRTKDLDIFVLAEDARRCLDVLATGGYRAELTFPHWLGKVFCGEEFIDVIFNSGNGCCPVDRAWFDNARAGRVFDIELRLCPVEEIIWQKAFILERDRCDVADVAHLLRRHAATLDWNRLIDRFGLHAPVLFAQIVLFDFIFPGHRDSVPAWVRSRLLHQHQIARPQFVGSAPIVQGTLLSASQYLRDIDQEGYHDARLPPAGNMNREQIAIWTANFMQH